jgi:quercetin dioxygenase-like cupin family protein
MTKHEIRRAFTLGLMLLIPVGCGHLRPPADAAKPAIEVRKLVQSTNSWDGAVLPAYPQEQPQVTILRITIPPGMRLPAHTHPTINAGVLLTGELTVVTAGGARLHLKAGDPIVEVVNTEHYGINEGTVPAEIIVVYAGAVGQPTSTTAAK